MTALQAAMATLATPKTPKLPVPTTRAPRKSKAVPITPAHKLMVEDGMPPEIIRNGNAKPPKTDAKTESKILSPSEAMALTKPTETAVKLAEHKKEKARVRVEKMLAKKTGAAVTMPLTGKAALDAIKRVTLIKPKTNGDKPLIDAHIAKNGVTKVPAGKTTDQLHADKRTKRRTAQTKDVKRVEKTIKTSQAPSGESKTEIARKMLESKTGATKEELKTATGWSVYIKRIAERAGKQVVEKNGRFRLV